MNSEGVTALVLGATGAIGREIVNELINSPRISKINLILRREFDVKHNKITESIVDFDELEKHKEVFSDASIAFCCLGTTRAKAGVKGFVKVDRDYVHEAAKILKENSCSHFTLVTSKGSNIDSSFLYLKTKGEAEKLLIDLEFPRLSIFRPSLLICDREQARPFEKVAQILAKGFDWRSKFSISVETVAHAMLVNAVLEGKHKVEILENDDINNLGID